MTVTERPERRMPSLWAIASYWTGGRDWFCIPLEYPQCFACQQTIPGIDQGLSLKDRWNSASGMLHRGHLVNRARDGLDGPQNLVPLCELCNMTMPIFSTPLPPGPVEWVLDGGWTQYFELTAEGFSYRRDWHEEINGPIYAPERNPARVLGIPTV